MLKIHCCFSPMHRTHYRHNLQLFMCSQRDALLQYGEYAAQLPKATERVSALTVLLECYHIICTEIYSCQSLSYICVYILQCKQLQAARNECARAMQACQERSQQRFSLSELLSVPLQRVLKYPLLVSVRKTVTDLCNDVCMCVLCLQELIKCAKKAGDQTEITELTNLHNFLNVNV